MAAAFQCYFRGHHSVTRHLISHSPAGCAVPRYSVSEILQDPNITSHYPRSEDKVALASMPVTPATSWFGEWTRYIDLIPASLLVSNLIETVPNSRRVCPPGISVWCDFKCLAFTAFPEWRITRLLPPCRICPSRVESYNRDGNVSSHDDLIARFAFAPAG